MATLNFGTFHPGDTDRLQITIMKDNVPWSGLDSVELTFEKPDRTTRFTRNAVLDDDIEAIWFYDTTTSDIPDEDASIGYWTVRIRMTDGAITKSYPHEIGLLVKSLP